jgi:hypothetical protein
MHAALVLAVAVAVLGAIAALVMDLPLLATVLAVLSFPPAAALFTGTRRARLGMVPPSAGAPGGRRTGHLVELYQVNSKPGEEEIEQFMYAQCGEEGCDFLEFGDPNASDEEASLRAKVSLHTTMQSPVIQIYV